VSSSGGVSGPAALAEIDRTDHTINHPIRLPEGAYLKCLSAIAP